MGKERYPVDRLFCGLFLLLLFPLLETKGQTDQPPAAGSSKQAAAKPRKKRASERTFVLVGAGDIASCKDPEGAAATAKLIEQIPGTVFAAGDLAYEKGSAEEFKKCYGPAWGRFKDRTKPALGNHEYVDPTASAYFQYWGAQAGPPGKGYYSYELGDWHIVVLNTNCDAKGLGGCGAGSPQETWLKEDLAKRPSACILAYGHHALFSSGVFKKHAVHPELKQLWGDLYAAHADLVLAGHEHSYERFALQDPEGRADAANGIREIVVGTGGRSHDLLGFATPNSEVREWDTYGVLKLTLSPRKYSWEFIPEEGKNFHDAGSEACHNYQSETD
ncbi:MAG TPA: metallophosphoesterase [Candidatus Acidoferrum sp.]|nr:metallophosphoesterase [Candidatus Acidoferrum sp.]